jgi:hypothetical protein
MADVIRIFTWHIRTSYGDDVVMSVGFGLKLRQVPIIKEEISV